MNLLEKAIEVLEIESLAISNLKQFMDKNFVSSVETLSKCTGRIVMTGIGKSAHIASKIVATLNSTGSPAIFMHAADAIHGDLGMIQKGDCIICISKSGSSPEIEVLVPLLKDGGNPLIGMVGNGDSYLAKNSDFLIRTDVEKESCPNDLAPTASSSAQLAMGHAIAVCLLSLKNFDTADFAKYHPGGSLGKKLYLKVSDLADKNEIPFVSYDASISTILEVITSKRLGATAVMKGHEVVGIITDGDIRRMVNLGEFNSLKANDIMGSNPKTIIASAYAHEAYYMMKEHAINHLVVLSEGKYSGMVHIQDLINEGIV